MFLKKLTTLQCYEILIKPQVNYNDKFQTQLGEFNETGNSNLYTNIL